eukprot:2559934-Pyramimonas_sp.AAC.1
MTSRWHDAVGGSGVYGSYALPPLTRLARATGICSLLSRDWLAPRAYAASSHATGSRRGYMLPALTRLAHVAGICSLLSRDWLSSCVQPSDSCRESITRNFNSL